jgi:hypothetical protein
MNEENRDIEKIVEAMAPALGITIAEDGRAAVINHLGIAFRMAPLVMDFPLDDHEEPAPVFVP